MADQQSDMVTNIVAGAAALLATLGVGAGWKVGQRSGSEERRSNDGSTTVRLANIEKRLDNIEGTLTQSGKDLSRLAGFIEGRDEHR